MISIRIERVERERSGVCSMEKCFSFHWPDQPHLLQFHEFNNSPFILPWPPHEFPSSSCTSAAQGIAEDPSVTASRSHSEAEKRRRERINGHLSTLRHIVPHSDKMDKAALLGNVVEHVKELKRKVEELGKVFTIPTDIDQVHVNVCTDTSDLQCTTMANKKDRLFLKASLCCDDRPDLLTDLIVALKGLKLKAVRADMATMGGRLISVMLLSTTSKDGEKTSVCLSSLKQSVKLVLTRVASFSYMASTSGLSSKRRRMLLSSN